MIEKKMNSLNDFLLSLVKEKGMTVAEVKEVFENNFNQIKNDRIEAEFDDSTESFGFWVVKEGAKRRKKVGFDEIFSGWERHNITRFSTLIDWAINDMTERKKYEEWKKKIGQIFRGKPLFYQNYSQSLMVRIADRICTILKRDQLLYDYKFRRKGIHIIPFVLVDVRLIRKKRRQVCELYGSRTGETLLISLLNEDIELLRSGQISIRKVVRIPGVRSKLLVDDEKLKAQGKRIRLSDLIGERGSMMRKISNQLSGERIDVIIWDENITKLMSRCFYPLEVVKVEKKSFNSKISQVVVHVRKNVASDKFFEVQRAFDNINMISKLISMNVSIVVDRRIRESYVSRPK